MNFEAKFWTKKHKMSFKHSCHGTWLDTLANSTKAPLTYAVVTKNYYFTILTYNVYIT